MPSPFSSPSPTLTHPPYFDYWGKARPQEDAAEMHLLPYHALDVAAVGCIYLQRAPALLAWFRQKLNAPSDDALRGWITFWLALHDLGKFSASFQGQRADLVERLQREPATGRRSASVRHDSLGMQFWVEHVQPRAVAQAWFGADPDFFDGIDCWVRAVTGHHGQPPLSHVPFLQDHYRPRDLSAANDFVDAMRALLLTPAAASVPQALDCDPEEFLRVSSELSWWLAGLSVLADWIGSNAEIFEYRAEPSTSLGNYWVEALTLADQALSRSGVLPVPRQAARPFGELFPAIAHASPLQAWAASVEIVPGPQIHLLEDVTGAGKTEAAVTLTHRLMAAGCADGFFIALPTMATANAMYGRIAEVYHRLFAHRASLVLAHGRKTLVEDFAASVVEDFAARVVEPGREERDPHQQDDSATSRCTTWLADHNKRALLAPAGVGTVDQALLGALQSKHQSLRLLGLVRKVLVIDEVHACDAYMQRTLEALLRFHARAGGSAILLSATLPARMKAALLKAFAKGCSERVPSLRCDAFPLVTSWAAAHPLTLGEVPLATRPDVRRVVKVRYETELSAMIAGITAALEAGHCVAWIRNTVADALDAQAELAARVPAERITMFHARFALGDRLDIEERVLATFGPSSGPAQRAGRLLIATQVAEQSLDVDFDVVVSDLAPIDRLIQRAGRLRRHVRDASGERIADPNATDRRGEPWLWVHGPAWTEAPAANWFKQAFPKAAAVYPHHGQLWLTAGLLRSGQFAMPGDARAWIESVFGDEAVPPPGLLGNANQAEGKAFGDASMAALNSVKLELGYVREGTEWTSDSVAPSRLGEETIDVLLAVWDGEQLRPWRKDKPPHHAWAYSTVRVAKRLIASAAPQASRARELALEAVRERLPGQGKWVVVLAFDWVGGFHVASARAGAKTGQESTVTEWRYDASTGLRANAPASQEGE